MPDFDPSTDISDEEFAAAVSPPDYKGRVNLRVEGMLQQELEDIADDTRYPLRSVSEVVRFCCLQGLERLHLWKPRPTLLGAIRAANAVVTRDRMQCEAMDLIARMDERIDWYIRRRHYDEAVAFVAQVRSNFQGLPDDFWAKHMVDEIDLKFIQWLDRIDMERVRNGS